jgi:hypothetical protein
MRRDLQAGSGQDPLFYTKMYADSPRCCSLLLLAPLPQYCNIYKKSS